MVSGVLAEVNLHLVLGLEVNVVWAADFGLDVLRKIAEFDDARELA